MTDAASPSAQPDWTKLAPGRPLGFNDPLYVSRPPLLGSAGGERIAALLRATGRPLVVAGPGGSGKSTELAIAAGLLQQEMVACPVPLDRMIDVHALGADEALHHIAGQLATMALSILRIKLSSELKGDLVAAGVLNPKHASNPPEAPRVTGAELLVRTLREVRKIGRRGHTVLLVDGLEKCPEATARAVTLSLLGMRDEAGLVVVAPAGLVTGPSSYEVLSQVRVVALRALPVMKAPGVPWQVAREFLRTVAQRRMGVETPAINLANLLNVAAEWSGGILRVFMQLVQDAVGYAAVMGREAPTLKDLDDAVRDLSEVTTCLLRDGDVAMLQGAEGTGGIEVPLERRLRYLEQGLMLEYDVDGHTVVHPAPLLKLGRR